MQRPPVKTKIKDKLYAYFKKYIFLYMYHVVVFGMQPFCVLLLFFSFWLDKNTFKLSWQNDYIRMSFLFFFFSLSFGAVPLHSIYITKQNKNNFHQPKNFHLSFSVACRASDILPTTGLGWGGGAGEAATMLPGEDDLQISSLACVIRFTAS